MKTADSFLKSPNNLNELLAFDQVQDPRAEVEQIRVNSGCLSLPVRLVKKSQPWAVDLLKGEIRLSLRNSDKQNARFLLAAYLRMAQYLAGEDGDTTEEQITHLSANAVLSSFQNNQAMWAFISKHHPQCRTVAEPEIPKELRIGQAIWTLKSMSDRTFYKENAYGLCVFGSRKILVYPKLNDEMRKLVSLHEVLHAVHHNAGLKKGSLIQSFAFEQAKALLKLAQHNPGFWSYILSR